MWDAQLLGTASHMRSNFVEDIGSSIKGLDFMQCINASFGIYVMHKALFYLLIFALAVFLFVF
jgi:hypothetical protein